MIKGNTQSKYIDNANVWTKTNGGYDIYAYYLGGKVGKSMKRPWGKPESKASWGIYPKPNGHWLWKDQATEETGNALHFVMKHFNLSFEDALAKVAWDFGLNTGKEINVTPVVRTWDTPDIERDYSIFSFDTKPFTTKHHDFWNIAEVTEDHLKKLNGYAVKSLAINRRKVNIGKDEIVFAFYAPSEDSVKIYFPERDKDKRFKNNVPFHYLWNYDNIGECDNGIVQKSFKDMAVTTLIESCTIATQAEAVKIFNEEVVTKINKVFKKTWIWYGSDWDGVKKCKEITDTYKWKYINTPKNLLPEINDTYGFVKMHNQLEPNTGLKKLEEFMKLKKLLK